VLQQTNKYNEQTQSTKSIQHNHHHKTKTHLRERENKMNSFTLIIISLLLGNSLISNTLVTSFSVKYPHGSKALTAIYEKQQSSSFEYSLHTLCVDDKSSISIKDEESLNNENVSRKRFIMASSTILTASVQTLATPKPAFAKCTDIETCREIGEKKVEQDMIDNPTIRLDSGVKYKVLQPGVKDIGGRDDSLTVVQNNSNIDLIFSISTLSGGYMYSRGFGFEKIDLGDGKLQSDLGLDSLRVQLGQRDVPLGIEEALVGMRKGERRRVELPPRVGFETSQWKPEPTTRRGKTRIIGYKQLLEGNGSTRPPFPAATIWDIEVLRIRK